MRRFSPDLTKIPGVSATAAHAIIAEIRGRHEPVCNGGTLALVGRAVSATQRECRQGHLAPSALWWSLAQNRAGAMRLGGHPQQAQLSPRSIPKAPSPPSPKKAILRWRPRSLLLPITCFAIRCPIAISERC